MNKRNIIIAIVGVIVVATLFVLFKKSKNTVLEINPEFTEHITAFTSGIVSKESKIKVRLRAEVSEEKQNEISAQDLFDFSPNIEGTIYWKDNQTVVFKPLEKLPSNQKYIVDFNLSELIETTSNLEVLTFQFQTMEQGISVLFDGMEAYDDTQLQWQKIKGSFSTADIETNEEIENIFKSLQKGKELNVKWEHAQDNRNHTFVVDSVERKEAKEKVTFEWNGKKIGAEENGELEIEIPALGDFKVMNIRVLQQPNQYISIRFSDPLKKNQDLEGLIYLKNNEELRFEINRNEIKAFPSTRIKGYSTLVVTEGVKNTLGYKVSEPFQEEVSFFNTKPAVEMIGKGVILPSTNGLVFPFKAVNLSAVNVKIVKVFEDNIIQFFQVNQFDGKEEMKRVGRIVYKKEVKLKSDKPIDYGNWNTFSLDLSEIIEVDPGALYRVSISFSKKHSLYPCTDDDLTEVVYEEENDKEEASFDQPNSYYYYDDYYYDYSDDYDWEERDNPCDDSYYIRNDKSITRNIFASDLGIIAKGGGQNTISVAITDLKTTNSLSGVEVKLYNFQQQVIAEGTTDSDGFVTIDAKNKPFLLIASQGNQKGYLRLDDEEALSTSMFDVNGQATKKGVKGIIYGERGVWRPGDSLFLAFMLEDKNNVIPENHPVVIELITPENQMYSRKVKTSSVNNLYSFKMKTSEDAPTGTWLAKVKVGGSSFTKSIRIEAVKPNRLKIALDFGGEILRSNVKTGELEVKWLHGAIAKGLKADVEMNIAKDKTTFKGYENFSFDDPSKDFESEEEMIFEGTLNQEGKATIRPNIKIKKNAPGMLKAQFKTRAFEEGGEFSIDRYVINYSPYEGYTGLKVPEGKGWNGALFSNENNLITIATVDEEGNAVDRKNLKIEVYDIEWSWWWERSQNTDLARYVRNKSNHKVATDFVNTKNGKVIYELNLGDEYWGRRFIRVTDPSTGHSTGKVVYFSYKGWWDTQSEGSGGAEMLNFTTDKKTYNVGDKVTVNLPEGKQGRALLSLETGSKVLSTRWIEIKDNNQFSFEATPEMAPNVFVNITLIQPHNQTINNLPIRLYGIQSIEVENKETHLNPVIKMPKVLLPEGDVEIKVSEENGKDMTFTIAVVEDGLLDLTRYKTPKPWGYFYAKEALSIKTWDMYKYVIGAFTGEMSGLLELGGDEFLNNKGSKKANRFKPVVKYFGPFQLDGGDTKTINFKMPNYVGSVRTMVVAGQDGAYGSAEETTPVKKPLMVLATLPRVLGPTEKVKLPVTVFAMDKKVKSVKIKVETNNLLKVVGSSTKTIQFNEIGEQVVNFDIDVANTIGIGKTKVTVSGGGEKATYEIELDVRIPNPSINKVTDGVALQGKNWENTYIPFGVKGTRAGIVEVSSIPSLGLENRLQYLIQYPHGCIEQTTSSVFPQMYLSNLTQLTNTEKDKIENNINNGINRIKKFQTANGGLSYWIGEYEESEWGTNYAGHFMIEAKNKGYQLPAGFLTNWVQFQKEKANKWTQTNNRYYRYSRRDGELIQAYRLYTLALAKQPVLGAMNRMREMEGLNSLTKWRLAAAYYLTGKPEIANQIISEISENVETYNNYSYTYGSRERDQAMIMETMLLMKDQASAFILLKEIAEKMNSNHWMSTQTTAYCLLAAGKFVGTEDLNNSFSYQININGKSKEITSANKPIVKHELRVDGISSGTINIINTGGKPLFINVTLTGTSTIGNEEKSASNLAMNVKYLDLDGNQINPAVIEQGSDFMAEITIKHTGIRGDYKDLAIEQIFPSGWEIRNLRMDELQTSAIKDKPRYQDIRDDRVYSYFKIDKSQRRVFRVLLNATYQGKFYLPSVKCEAMYDATIQAIEPGQWVEVVSSK